MIQKKTLSAIGITLTLFTGCSTEVKEEKKRIPMNSVKDVQTNLAPVSQSFQVNSKEENIVKGVKGTSLYIPANAFQFADGSTPAGSVTIELKECYDLSAMIAENLSTTSNEQILQTAGMIYLTASADGKELAVKEGKAVVVAFPKNGIMDTMDLFYNYTDYKGNSTWIADYEMYNTEAISEAQKNPPPQSEYQGVRDTAASPNYPIEITDDLYDYGLGICAYNGIFYDLNLQGHNRSIIEYVRNIKIPDSTARQFYADGLYISYDVRIDVEGKMYEFKTVENERRYNKSLLKYTKDLLKNLPPFDFETYEWEGAFNHLETYSLGICADREINQDRYKAKFRAQYAQYTNKAIQKIDPQVLNHYVFSATRLGWINCDAFWDTEGEKINFIVKTPSPKDTKVSIVFEDINSIMNGKLEDNQVVFENIPLGRKIKIIGINCINGKPTLGMAKTVVDKDGFELTAFKEFSLDQLEAALNKPE